MSDENVEFVRRAAEAWNSGGVEALLEFCPEDVVWYPFPDAPAGSTGLHGHDGVREVMAGWSESFDEWRIEVAEVRDLGDTVLALGEVGGTIRGSGVPMRQPMGWIVSDFGEAGAREARFFTSWEAALEAAGLSRGNA